MIELILFSERLKSLMFDKKVTAVILSNSLNIDVTAVYKWWNAKQLPEFDNFIGLAEYFECSIEFLTGRRLDDSENIIYKPSPQIGVRLKEFIKQKGVKKLKLCKEIGISQSMLYYWFKGARKPTIESIIKLADYFDCTIDYLIGRE